MRRLLSCLVFAVLCAAAIWPATQVSAQQEQQSEAEPQHRQKAAEFVRLWGQLQKTEEPADRIAWSEEALKLEGEVATWPLQISRSMAQAQLWWWSGLGHAARRDGKREENLERAIAAYERAGQTFTRETAPKEWAALQGDIADVHWLRRFDGVRGENVEKAIALYEASLTVFTREAYPREWALTQYRVGYAYQGRVLGDRGDSLDKAIGGYEAALSVLTREADPRTFASIQFTLADAYQVRPHGERADNLERAIAAYEAVLSVRTREADPRGWGWAQERLAAVYRLRLRGDRADNLEKAIGLLDAALTVLTREAMDHVWAHTQTSLAGVYSERLHGDRADNLEKAIAAYEAALTVRTREADPRGWASVQYGLGSAYLSRIRGDRADNLEKAVEFYQAALTVWTREASPDEWAWTQRTLADVYETRIRGSRADNVEKAIALYEAVLTLWTREANLQGWAMTQHSLAAAYENRLHGNRADNLEKAIALYEAALTVRTRDARPLDWAATRHKLGGVYTNRMLGERADNLEKAIEHYEAALAVRTRQARPLEWATTQHSLGVLYPNRVRGDRADNLEKSIAHLEAALSVRTPAGQPRAWADAQRNLGLAFGQRTRGERADNVEKGIAAFEAALTVLNPESFPQDWAQVESALALLYTYRIRGERADNREKAIVHLHAALRVLTREAFPSDWGMAQFNLGYAYNERQVGSRPENLERAIQHFEAALTVMTREANPRVWALAKMALGQAQSSRIGSDPATAIAAFEAALTVYSRAEFPLEWSVAQGYLAGAYLDSAHGDRQAILAKAIGHLEAALSVQRQSAPRDSVRLLRLLGAALSEKGEWRRAGSAYADARQTFLLLFAQGLDDTAASALIGEAGPLFSEAAYAAAQLGETETALTLASEGRARLMATALRLQTLDLPDDARRHLDKLRADIRVAERTAEAQTTQGAERAATVERLVALRRELMDLVKNADAAEAKARGSSLAQARALAGRSGAVAVPIVTRLGGKILIVGAGPSRPKGVGAAGADAGTRPGKPAKASTAKRPGARVSAPAAPTPIDLPELTAAALDVLVRGDGRTGGWLGAYAINAIADDDELDRRWQEWMAAIDGLGPDLWRLVGARLDAALKRSGVKAGARLVWLPTGALGILPLGLAQNPASKRRLQDSYEIVYAPSLEALASAQGRIAESAPATLAVVVNPTGDLPAAQHEGRLVASRFSPKARSVLEGAAATPEAVLDALKGRSYWHFASHGIFSWGDARQSALLMHGFQRLSVGRLLDTGGLGRPRLVVLSACETGLYDISRNPDEFIGLPGTFTALGAAGVLGTLWPVNDMATALLVAKFYDLHLAGKLAPPTALRRAQLWLRRATNTDLLAYARDAARQGRLDRKYIAVVEEELSTDSLRRARKRAPVEWIGPQDPAGADKPERRSAIKLARPYAHPYYWAGFIYTGL